MNVLVVEDNPGDLAWILAALEQHPDPGMMCVGVASLTKAQEHVKLVTFDAVLLDFSLPDSRGLETLLRFKPLLPGCPVIVLTGLDDEMLGRRAVQEGAEDYLVKDDCTARSLYRAVVYAVERHKLRGQLQTAHAEISSLRGMLPICAGCKKIRSAEGEWQQLEAYLHARTQANFTHSVCPDCAERYRR